MLFMIAYCITFSEPLPVPQEQQERPVLPSQERPEPPFQEPELAPELVRAPELQVSWALQPSYTQPSSKTPRRATENKLPPIPSSSQFTSFSKCLLKIDRKLK
jgi:hypothetical protein